MKKVTAIKNLFGEKVKLENYEVIHIGKDYVTMKFKNYGFIKTFAPYDGYTVTIQEVEE